MDDMNWLPAALSFFATAQLGSVKSRLSCSLATSESRPVDFSEISAWGPTARQEPLGSYRFASLPKFINGIGVEGTLFWGRSHSDIIVQS